MSVDEDMKGVIENWRYHINSDNFDKLLVLNFFKNYCKMLFADTSGTQAYIINQCIKDVSSMLPLIFTVRENF